MKTSIATVCLSGGLSEKLQSIAAAGFRGVEIFESDLLSYNGTPADVAREMSDLGLRAITFQPFRDFEGMRNQTPLVPGQSAFDVTVYIVLNYYGSRLGRAYAETGDDEADEKTTIENILSGQHSHPIRVIAFNTAEGWSRDVTEDIANAILSTAQRERRSISIAGQEFLVRVLGVDAPKVLSAGQ